MLTAKRPSTKRLRVPERPEAEIFTKQNNDDGEAEIIRAFVAEWATTINADTDDSIIDQRYKGVIDKVVESVVKRHSYCRFIEVRLRMLEDPGRGAGMTSITYKFLSYTFALSLTAYAGAVILHSYGLLPPVSDLVKPFYIPLRPPAPVCEPSDIQKTLMSQAREQLEKALQSQKDLQNKWFRSPNEEEVKKAQQAVTDAMQHFENVKKMATVVKPGDMLMDKISKLGAGLRGLGEDAVTSLTGFFNRVIHPVKAIQDGVKHGIVQPGLQSLLFYFLIHVGFKATTWLMTVAWKYHLRDKSSKHGEIIRNQVESTAYRIVRRTLLHAIHHALHQLRDAAVKSDGLFLLFCRQYVYPTYLLQRSGVATPVLLTLPSSLPSSSSALLAPSSSLPIATAPACPVDWNCLLRQSCNAFLAERVNAMKESAQFQQKVFLELSRELRNNLLYTNACSSWKKTLAEQEIAEVDANLAAVDRNTDPAAEVFDILEGFRSNVVQPAIGVSTKAAARAATAFFPLV